MSASGDEEMVVKAETTCNPSEELEKVKECMSNVIDAPITTIRTSEETYRLTGTARGRDALERIALGFRQRQVLMVVRRHLKRGIDGNEIRFRLNKQAAYAGAISLAEEGGSPLGAISVTVRHPNPRDLIDRMTHF